MIGNGDTATYAADRFNNAASVRNDREGRLVKTHPSLTAVRRKNMWRLTRLRRRARERAMTGGEERLARPVGREMKPETADTPPHAGCDFEQLQSDRPDGRRRQARPGKDGAPEVGEQQQGDAMQLESEGVRAEMVTAKSIGVDVELEFLNPILGRPAVVIPRDEIGRPAAAVRDHEADVETLGRNVDLDENPPVMRPGLRAMPKARSDLDRSTDAIVARLGFRDESRHAGLEDAIRPDAEHVADPLGFQLRLDGGRRHAGIATQEDRRVRKAPPQRRKQVPEIVHDTGRTRIATDSF